MLQILESILGNKATEWLNQHTAGGWAIGALAAAVAVGWVLKWRRKATVPVPAAATAQSSGNVVNIHLSSNTTDVAPAAPRTSVVPPEVETYFREQRASQPQRIEHVHRVVIEPRPLTGVTATGGEWEQDYREDLLAQATSALNIELAWKPNIGSGATPGMWLQATNKDSETVEVAKLFITDVRKWDETIGNGAFVTTPDIHGGGTTFTEVHVDTATLHPGSPATIGFLRYELHRLEIQTQRQEHVRMTIPGIRRISYRIQAKDGRQTTGSICFSWKGPENPGKWPEPCECPRSAA